MHILRNSDSNALLSGSFVSVSHSLEKSSQISTTQPFMNFCFKQALASCAIQKMKVKQQKGTT